MLQLSHFCKRYNAELYYQGCASNDVSAKISILIKRVNSRKVRSVYMKVKSKGQSFSKLYTTFDSLVLVEHFIKK